MPGGSRPLRGHCLRFALAQGESVLACLRDGRPLAAVFSLPSSHRTIQLKSPVTDIAPCTRDDRPVIERYIRDLPPT